MSIFLTRSVIFDIILFNNSSYSKELGLGLDKMYIQEVNNVCSAQFGGEMIVLWQLYGMDVCFFILFFLIKRRLLHTFNFN